MDEKIRLIELDLLQNQTERGILFNHASSINPGITKAEFNQAYASYAHDVAVNEAYKQRRHKRYAFILLGALLTGLGVSLYKKYFMNPSKSRSPSRQSRSPSRKSPSRKSRTRL